MVPCLHSFCRNVKLLSAVCQHLINQLVHCQHTIGNLTTLLTYSDSAAIAATCRHIGLILVVNHNWLETCKNLLKAVVSNSGSSFLKIPFSSPTLIVTPVSASLASYSVLTNPTTTFKSAEK